MSLLPNHLSDRHQYILWATVRHYVATAEPVGSKTLVAEYNLGASSATIRQALGSLEKAGFLYQPHTSAGRIPSDSGYRIYVDRLMTPDDSLGRKIETIYAKQLEADNHNLELLLQRAAQILARLSGQIALITLPQTTHELLRHLQLIQVDSSHLMLTVVTDSYHTHSVLVNLPQVEPESELEISEEELQILSNFLTTKWRGQALSSLANLDGGELDRDFKHYSDILQNLRQELGRRTNTSPSSQILIRGIAEALRQPEFSQLQQVQTILHLLELEQESLYPLIFEQVESGHGSFSSGVTVRIGAENCLEPLNSCTLISAPYKQGEIPVGSVGLLGPTRMLYESAIPLVEATADYLSDVLS